MFFKILLSLIFAAVFAQESACYAGNYLNAETKQLGFTQSFPAAFNFTNLPNSGDVQYDIYLLLGTHGLHYTFRTTPENVNSMALTETCRSGVAAIGVLNSTCPSAVGATGVLQGTACFLVGSNDISVTFWFTAPGSGSGMPTSVVVAGNKPIPSLLSLDKDAGCSSTKDLAQKTPAGEMAEDWNEYAAGWDEKPGVKEYSNAFFSKLTALVPDLKSKKVLDFGCGSGLLASQLVAAGATVTAVDISDKMIGVLKGKSLDVVAVCVDLDNGVPSEVSSRGPFDLVVASSALAFVPDFTKTLTTLTNLLGQGGLLMHTDWLDKGKMDEEVIRAAFKAAGLELIKAEEAFCVNAGGHEMKPLLGFGKKF